VSDLKPDENWNLITGRVEGFAVIDLAEIGILLSVQYSTVAPENQATSGEARLLLSPQQADDLSVLIKGTLERFSQASPGAKVQ
jgi:hypothetical protein